MASTRLPLARARCCPLALAAFAVLAGAGSAKAQVYTRLNENGVVEATNVPDSAGYRLTYPGKGTLIHSRGFHHSYSGQFDHHVEAASRLNQVGADLVKAVIAVESEFDQWAVSSKGAQGLMQLMPATARRFGVTDPFDARQNIFAGAKYLRILLDQFRGDVALALAAYNAGENAVVRYRGVPPYRETRGYIDKVQALLHSGFAPDAPPSTNTASFYVPSTVLRPPSQPARTAPRSRSLEPARPHTYYRWRDERGRTRVAEAPPPEGTVYTTIRALD
jgi:hypothetical protein